MGSTGAGVPHLPPGYEYIRPLGSGGFGEVVLARQTSLGRRVAIKRIHEWVADADNVARFRREASVLASTRCPTVVQVFDLTVENGVAWLVMEYVPGRSLYDVLVEGTLPLPAAVVVLRDVALALDAMAAQGLVHRDVKPGNVFVLPDGHAKLGDFGLARPMDDSDGFRTAGPPTGTPAYFPPEVSQGLAEPDARSDAYSFAVMAYEMVVGARPFDAPDAVSMITAHWHRQPPIPSQVVPGLPRQLDEPLLRGLAKEPAQRLSPMELVDRLAAAPTSAWPGRDSEAAAQGQAVTTVAQRPAPTTVRVELGPASQPPRAGVRQALPRKRPGPRWLRPVLMTAALVAVVGGLGVWRVSQGSDPPAPPLEVLRVSVEVDRGSAECPAADFHFTGVLHTNGGSGSVTVQWIRPDGEPVPERTLEVSPSQREVVVELDFSVQGPRPLRGAAELQVVEEGGAQASETIRYRCPREG